jgi:hypothetical protein
MSPNNSRTFAAGARPDWPKFLIRNIPPALWDQVKTRALADSADGNPRINAVCVRLLQLYATHGLPPDREAAVDKALADTRAALDRLHRMNQDKQE